MVVASVIGNFRRSKCISNSSTFMYVMANAHIEHKYSLQGLMIIDKDKALTKCYVSVYRPCVKASGFGE